MLILITLEKSREKKKKNKIWQQVNNVGVVNGGSLGYKWKRIQFSSHSRSESLREHSLYGKMESISLTHLSPEEEVTLEWDSKLLTDKGMLLMDIPMEQEITVNQTQAMESENC